MDDFNYNRCPEYAPFFSAIGSSAAITFSCFGASYGMAKSGVGIMASSVMHPESIMRNMMPPILAGILSIYGLVVAVLIVGDLQEELPLYSAFLQLASGISVGLCALASGFAIGIVGDAGVRGCAQQPKIFTGMILILIFAEVLGLYGMITSLMLMSQSTQRSLRPSIALAGVLSSKGGILGFGSVTKAKIVILPTVLLATLLCHSCRVQVRFI